MNECATPESCPINPIQFGKLIQSVATLTIEVQTLRHEMTELSNQMSGGKGVVAGMLLAAGGVGAGAAHLVDKLFK